jgi:tripartite-type tricarboxylate transporter receptor subunit TctC
MRTIRNIALVYAASCTALTMTTADGADLAPTQQKFPSKPIRLLVSTSPGTPPDTMARMMGEKMGASWGQPVVVDSRPGAGGALAAGTVAKAAPDGHTLLMVSGFAITAALQPNLPYDPLKDFARVGQLGHMGGVLVVAPALGVKSVKELIALANAQPGKIIYGSNQAGSGNHLTGARFIRAAGIKVISVAFKGSPEATIEVLAGRTHYTLGPLATALPFIKDGKLLALAVMSHSPLLPEVPTLAETLPEFKRTDVSYGLLAPAGTPRPVLHQINQEVARILDLPDIKARLQPTGFVTATSTPEEYDKILREQIEIVSGVARDLGLKSK